MLETPRMKLVKMNMEHIETESNFMQDFHDKFMEKMLQSFADAEEEIIQKFAENEDLSLKCAKYFINKSFKFKPEIIYPDNPFDTPTVAITLVPKTPEEILHDIDTLPTTDELNECEKELLEKHSNDKCEWIK